MKELKNVQRNRRTEVCIWECVSCVSDWLLTLAVGYILRYKKITI